MAKTTSKKDEKKERGAIPIPLIFGGLVGGAILLYLGLRGRGEPIEGTATLFGYITDASDDSPISGATVEVEGVASANTDNEGWYQIVGIPPGYYPVAISAEGYQTAVY